MRAGDGTHHELQLRRGTVLRPADIVQAYGPITVAGFIALEGMGLPLPGEVVLIAAGALAAQGDFSIVAVAVAAWIGTVIGGTGGYWIGRTGGAAFIRRHGRWLGVTAERERVATEFIGRHGASTIIIARFIAVLRMVAGILAGSLQMPFGLFSLCNAIGGLLWSATFAAVGYFFGSNIKFVERYVSRGTVGLLVILITVALGLLYRRRRRASKTTEDGLRNDQPPS
ncbi:MAG: DedA family protein [Gemmatimonadota bacterium]|nr:DedA family protein [Gemmatimonadota bacterium]